LRLFPIGGFCAMEGEDEESEDPEAFNNRPIPSRLLVLFAGALMNILLAVVLVWMIFFSLGEPSTYLKTVIEDSPAAQAGLSSGDHILSLDGTKIKKWEDINAFIAEVNKSYEKSDAKVPPVVKIEFETADGTTKTIDAKMIQSEETGAYIIGITPEFRRGGTYFFRSFGEGVLACGRMMKLMYQTIGDLFTGKAGIDQLTGPIGIVTAVGESAKGGFVYVVQLAALISLNLGIVNLLPLPALDGGRIVFLIIRLFTGKRISESLEAKIHLVGILLLFALMIYITVIDVDRFILK
jgi:regulator of sigma E protease